MSNENDRERKPVYRPGDEGGVDYEKDLGDPGSYPFTRGPYADMYRGKRWTMRQYAGFGTAADTNARFRFLREQGQTGLSVAFDLPTQMGYDPDHGLAKGEVGRVGVSIATLEDMEVLFDGIPLDEVSTSMTINSTGPILLAMYVAVAEKQGVAPEALRGTLQNDILKEYVARGTYIYPPKPSVKLATDVFAFTAEFCPRYNPISISGYHIREAGATAVQELAFTFAHAIAYVEAAIDRGLDVDLFAPRLSFFFNSQSDLLEEVAKFRAARRIWARLMKDRFQAKDPRSMRLRFHAQTAGSSLTASQIDVNVARVTVQALAAVLGGAQSIHTNSKDEALGLPTVDAALVALRTQQVLANESGVADTADPLGGSYCIEALTSEIEADVMHYIARIDEQGGPLAAVDNGFIEREIEQSAYEYQREIERGDRVIVGVNAYQAEDEPDVPVLRIDPATERSQVERLVAVRERRDGAAVASCLEALEAAAGRDENLMPLILAAVRAYVTLGEISDALRRVYGEHRPSR